MGFRCLDPETLRVKTLLHVSFDENSIEHRRDKLREWDRRADAFRKNQLGDLPLIQDDWEMYAKDHDEFAKAREVRRLFVDYDRPFEHEPHEGEPETDEKELLDMTPLPHPDLDTPDGPSDREPTATATSSSPTNHQLSLIHI